MGMALQLRRAHADALSKLSLDEEAGLEFICPTDDEHPAYTDGSITDIDKAWHAIHFLLTKQPWSTQLPSGFLLAGTEVGAELDYGAIRVLSPSQVSDIADHLSTLPADFVNLEFDFEKLQSADIYPSIWDSNDPEDITYTASYFEDLKQFVTEAASRGEGIAIAIL